MDVCVHATSQQVELRWQIVRGIEHAVGIAVDVVAATGIPVIDAEIHVFARGQHDVPVPIGGRIGRVSGTASDEYGADLDRRVDRLHGVGEVDKTLSVRGGGEAGVANSIRIIEAPLALRKTLDGPGGGVVL